MKIPLEQILEDHEVQRTICLMVQAEVEPVQVTLNQKVHQLQRAEEENFFLRNKIVQLEKQNLRNEVKLRELRREILNERARMALHENKGDASDEEKNDHATVHDYDMTKQYGWFCSCGAEFPVKPNLTRHVRYYQDRGHNFKCTMCTSRFKVATALKYHLISAHKTQAAPWMRFGCRTCGCFFQYAGELFAHRKENHSKVSFKELNFIQSPCQEKIPEDNKEQLDKIYDMTSLRMHGQPHGFAKILNTTINTKNSKKLTRLSKKNMVLRRCRFLCQCGRDFIAMKALQRHVRCEKSFV